jgi:hypothetical protein
VQPDTGETATGDHRDERVPALVGDRHDYPRPAPHGRPGDRQQRERRGEQHGGTLLEE